MLDNVKVPPVKSFGPQFSGISQRHYAVHFGSQFQDRQRLHIFNVRDEQTEWRVHRKADVVSSLEEHSKISQLTRPPLSMN